MLRKAQVDKTYRGDKKLCCDKMPIEKDIQSEMLADYIR